MFRICQSNLLMFVKLIKLRHTIERLYDRSWWGWSMCLGKSSTSCCYCIRFILSGCPEIIARPQVHFTLFCPKNIICLILPPEDLFIFRFIIKQFKERLSLNCAVHFATSIKTINFSSLSVGKKVIIKWKTWNALVLLIQSWIWI